MELCASIAHLGRYFGLAQSDTEPEPLQIGAEAEILKESSAQEPLPPTTICVRARDHKSQSLTCRNPLIFAQFPFCAILPRRVTSRANTYATGHGHGSFVHDD